MGLPCPAYCFVGVEVSKIPGTEKLVLTHIGLSKLSVIKKKVDVPVISGVVLWRSCTTPLGLGFRCLCGSSEVLTFPRCAERRFYSLSRGGIWLGHFGLDSYGPFKELPGECFVIWASRRFVLC